MLPQLAFTNKITQQTRLLHACFLSLFLCLFPIIAQAGTEGYAQLQAYSVPPPNTENGTPQKSVHPPMIVVTLAVIPPDQSYFYGTQETIGLPTTFTVKAIDIETGKELAVTRSEPRALDKQKTALASEVLLGVDDRSALIYPASAIFLAEIPLPPKGVRFEASISGLFCSSANCSPFSYKFSPKTITPTTSLPSIIDAPWHKEWSKGEPLLLERVDTTSAVLEKQVSLGALDSSASNSTNSFFTGGAVSSDTLTSGTPASPHNATAPSYVLQRKLEPQSHLTAFEVSTFWQALLFGMAAGLILNLMPCVLPVITLKFSALLSVSTMRHKENQAKVFRWHCLLFALGILTWFGFLAIMVGVAGWAWGEVFQHPVAVAVMGLLLFLLGLSMFNVYTLPVIDFKMGRKGNPHWQAFASGLLATLLATPCSGPFLGGVISWVIHQPIVASVITILAVGVGMTLPYLVLAFFPRLINLLPKPGGWTLRLEQLMGFMLMAGVAYFMLLLPAEWYAGYLITLLAIAFSAWLWGQIAHLNAPPRRRFIARSAAIIILGCSLILAKSTLHKSFDWEPFSAQKVTALLGNEPLLLEFTADWCPNCKVLEHTTLQDERMMVLRDRYKMRTIRVDLTRFDELGFALLEELGSKTLPFIALFPTGEKANKPVILRDIVTPRQLEEALEAAFNK